MTDGALEGAFKRYYRERSSLVFVPDISFREFMFITFGEKVIRHVSLPDLELLRRWLEAEAPRHAYYSVALYKSPEATDMSQKGPQSAEVLFDIDADELELECRKEHDLWRCEECGALGRWPSPALCPQCRSKRVRGLKWICPICLEAAKREAMKLVNQLTSDLGVPKEEIIIAYTGHRGYHVRVRNREAMQLGKRERRELSDLVYGAGIDPKILVRVARGNGSVLLPTIDQGGWRGRFARAIGGVLEGSPPNWISKGRADYLKTVPGMKEVISEGNPIQTAGPKLVRVLRSLVKGMVSELGVKIDRDVTSDPQRFTRVPNTLHGKTGLRSITLSPLELEGFDPLRDALGLKDEQLRVKVVEEVPKFSLGGESFGPFERGESPQLPIQASALIILKGRGIVA